MSADVRWLPLEAADGHRWEVPVARGERVDRFKAWPHSAHITLRRGERSRLADFASDVL